MGRRMKILLQWFTEGIDRKNNSNMYFTYNEGKSVVAETIVILEHKYKTNNNVTTVSKKI